MIRFRRRKSIPDAPAGNLCSFCSKAEAEVSKLCFGPNDAHICEECLEVAEEIFKDQKEHTFSATRLGFQCSFCLKSDEEVNYLVAGPAVYICDGCVFRFRQSPIAQF